MSVAILALGAVCVDYLVRVPRYPLEDEKLRAEESSVSSGGNAANTLCAIARLGIASSLVSKWGDDIYGKILCDDMLKECINFEYSVIDESDRTSFTYIIVNTSTQSRTCIHTPLLRDLNLSNISERLLESLSAFSLVHFDSRHTEAALSLASKARLLGIPMSIDCEKDRPPHLQTLLPLMDLIFSNEHFCDAYLKSRAPNSHVTEYSWAPEPQESRSDNYNAIKSNVEKMIALCECLKNQGGAVKAIISTFGSKGAIIVYPVDVKVLSFPRSNHALNTNAKQYLAHSPMELCQHDVSCSTMNYVAIRISSWPISLSEIVDTTGAGDAFIGGFLAGLSVGYTYEECLRLASVVATLKIRAPGARTGLPTIEDLVYKLRNS